MSATLDEYQRQAEKLGSDVYMGRLFWYSLSNVRLPHDEMIRLLAHCNIVRNLPNVPEDFHVFKRVCSSVKRKKLPTGNPDQFDNYRLVEFRDDDTITRRVVRETVDNKGRRLDFTEMMDVVFDRNDSTITGTPIAHELANAADFAGSETLKILNEIVDGFKHWQGCLDALGVRQWVRKMLEDTNATMVKAGVYFVAEEHVPRIDALECFAAGIASGGWGEVDFHSLPLIDDQKQRDMVKRAFEAETSDAMDAMIQEIGELAGQKRRITIDRYERIVADYQRIMDRTKEYETMLEFTLATTNTRVNVFQKALMNLRLNVKG